MAYNYSIGPEEGQARILTQYLELLKNTKKILVFTHVSNETYTKSWTQKARNKAMGVRPGTPDYIIIFPHVVLFLELKREKGGVVSSYQKEWLRALGQEQKTKAAVAQGFNEAKQIIDDIIKDHHE